MEKSEAPITDQASAAEQLILSVFLANEIGWREWYDKSNAGASPVPPHGVAKRLVTAVDEAIKAAFHSGRVAGLREAAKLKCMYCNDPVWPTMDTGGHHRSPVSESLFSCGAIEINRHIEQAAQGNQPTKEAS